MYWSSTRCPDCPQIIFILRQIFFGFPVLQLNNSFQRVFGCRYRELATVNYITGRVVDFAQRHPHRVALVANISSIRFEFPD